MSAVACDSCDSRERSALNFLNKALGFLEVIWTFRTGLPPIFEELSNALVIYEPKASEMYIRLQRKAKQQT